MHLPHPKTLMDTIARSRYLFKKYINNSLHLARKYAPILASLSENGELRGTDNVQGQISEHIFKVKLRLLCLLSIGFKNWGIFSK